MAIGKHPDLVKPIASDEILFTRNDSDSESEDDSMNDASADSNTPTRNDVPTDAEESVTEQDIRIGSAFDRADIVRYSNYWKTIFDASRKA